VTEYDYAVSDIDGERPVLKVAYMKVSRKILQEASSVWRVVFNKSGPWDESPRLLVDLNDDTVVSLELWLRCLNGAMTEDMYKIPVEEIWHSPEVCRKYFLKVEMLNAWFTLWWDSQDQDHMKIDNMRELLYPCHEFEHSIGFSFLTKFLAYNVAGHITENPTHHRYLHLGHHVIRPLNHQDSKLLR
jgi:hypothetical protein